MRMRWSVPLLVLVVAYLSACDSDKPPKAIPSGPQTASGDATASAIWRCSDVPTVPTKQEVETTLDPEKQLLTFSFGAPESADVDQVTVAYAVDDSCAARSDIMRVVESAILANGQSVDPGVTAADEDAALWMQQARSFIAFSQHSTTQEAAEVQFFTPLRLSLGQTILIKSIKSPKDEREWSLSAPAGYAGQSGAISALSTLVHYLGASADPKLRLSVGPHPACVGPPVVIGKNLAGLTQVSLQPEHQESCLDWFSIDLFLDRGEIRAVNLDLFEP